MVQLVNWDFSVPVHNTLRPHIKHLAPITRVSRKTLLLFDRRGEKFDRRFLAITLFTEG
jgi:hypothetical protein